MDLTQVPVSTREDVNKLEELTKIASEQAVNNEYTSASDTLITKMNGNIKARDILEMLLDYPEREYPEPEEIDPKKKKSKEEPKKKKRKKKEPPFPIPEWATELEAVISQVNQMQSLISDRENLQLDEEFVSKVNVQLGRFKKEIAFRKKLEEEARLEAELKKMKKKAKK